MLWSGNERHYIDQQTPGLTTAVGVLYPKPGYLPDLLQGYVIREFVGCDDDDQMRRLLARCGRSLKVPARVLHPDDLQSLLSSEGGSSE